MFDAHCDDNGEALHHKLFILCLKDTLLPITPPTSCTALTYSTTLLPPPTNANLDYYSCSLQPLTPPPRPPIPPSTLGSLLALLLFFYFFYFARHAPPHSNDRPHKPLSHNTHRSADWKAWGTAIRNCTGRLVGGDTRTQTHTHTYTTSLVLINNVLPQPSSYLSSPFLEKKKKTTE